LQIWGIIAGANDAAGCSVTGNGGQTVLGLRSSLKFKILPGVLYQVGFSPVICKSDLQSEEEEDLCGIQDYYTCCEILGRFY